MFQGFGERMPNELAASAPQTMQINVIGPPERNFSMWVGGASPIRVENGLGGVKRSNVVKRFG